jgi:hypothetical protein
MGCVFLVGSLGAHWLVKMVGYEVPCLIKHSVKIRLAILSWNGYIWSDLG